MRNQAIAALALALAIAKVPALAEEDAFDKAMHTYGCADYPKAFAMVVPLAESGHVLAQYQMAPMLEQGQGAAANLAEAYKWYGKAAAFDVAARLGYAVAGDWRGMVAKTLNDEQMTKARKTSAELLARRPAAALDRIR